MDIIEKYKNCYNISFSIIDNYNKLLELLTINEIEDIEFNDIIKSISELIEKENKAYSNLSQLEIKAICEGLKAIPESNLSIKDIRVIQRIKTAFDKLNGLTIVNGNVFPFLNANKKLSISDIINSKIVIDTILLVTRKIASLNCSNAEEQEFADELENLNRQHALYKLNLYELSETIAIKHNYQLNEISPIDLTKIEDKITTLTSESIKLTNLANSQIFRDFMTFLNSFQHARLIASDIESIYDNLYFISHLEVLLPYLTKEQLYRAYNHCLAMKFKNSLIRQNVNAVIKRRILEIEQ